MSTTATRTSTVTFYSPHRNLTLVRVPEDKEIVRGGKERTLKGIRYSFETTPHFLTVKPGQDMEEDGIDPDTGALVEQDAIGWLRNHPKFGSQGPGGFDEYREPTPESSDTLMAILRAQKAGDTDALSAILENERQTHQREDVIEACLDALA